MEGKPGAHRSYVTYTDTRRSAHTLLMIQKYITNLLSSRREAGQAWQGSNGAAWSGEQGKCIATDEPSARVASCARQVGIYRNGILRRIALEGFHSKRNYVCCT
jgi:hypothetical protein